jgi:2-C-methyl-D-erythritol 4-phosphate cytidylyltransferase
MNCTAIIPSGGVGTRFNSPIPKQYVKVLGKELIAYTLDIFQKCDLVDNIIIPASESYFGLLYQIKERYNLSKISKIVKGGLERQDSVYNALISSPFDDDDLIIVHDAARPLLSQEILENAINSVIKYDSIVVAINARDTLFQTLDDKFNYLDRSNIYYAQTPQLFRYSILKDSFLKAIESNFKATDESMLVQNANYSVKVVEGEHKNFKITTEADMLVFEKMIR